MTLKKIILSSLILTLINADSTKLENFLLNNKINEFIQKNEINNKKNKLKVHKSYKSYTKPYKSNLSENDIKYSFNYDVKKSIKKLKGILKYYNFEGGHKDNEYYIIKTDCLMNICYGFSLDNSNNSTNIIFKLE